MKAHTNNFKNEIKLYGKQLDSKIIYPSLSGTVELGVNELNSITPHYEGGILKSVMRGLTIDSNVEIPKGTMLNYQFGVLVNGSFEYINFGNYIVDTVEKQEDTNSYLIECCDSMLYAMKDYEAPNITYPITVRSYINAICNKIGLTFKNASDTFANYDKEIPNELYSDIGYTYRNVLDELAQVTASTICINEVDDELEIRYINNTSSVLPKGYTQVDYIESSGTGSYINTNYYPTSDTTIELDYKFVRTTSSTTAIPIMGERPTYGSNFKFAIWVNPSSNRTALNFGDYDSGYVANSNPKVRNVITTGNSKLYYNGNLVASSYERTFSRSSLPIYLFGLNENGNILHRNQVTQLYSLKIYEKNSLVRNFIPCYRNSDNEIGLYDLVNNVFYTNQGSGEFTQGNVLLDTIDEEYLKDVNVNFGEKYGPVNSIVLTRAGGSDSIYLKDQESIDENGLCELKIEDNQIMNLNDRADYLPDILEVLDGFEYYTNDFSSTGICYYNLCDRYNVQVGENIYSCVMFNDEVDITQGLEEFIHTDMPEESETEYKYASKDDRQRNQAYIIAKKNEAEIEALASKIVDISNTISGVGQIQLENAYEGILHRLEITGNISVLYPSDDLYPSNDLYPKICNLLVDETLYNLDFEYLNYINDNVCDKYVYEDGKQWVERNVGIDEYGQKYALSETVIEQDEDINIYVEKESNISMVAFNNVKFKCDYLLENEYTSTFANQVEVTSELNLLGDTLEAKVSSVADEDGNVTSASIILAVNNDESQAVINADKISLEGKQINLTSDDIVIESTNFSVDKDGKITSTAGEIGGFNLDAIQFYNNISGKYDYTDFDSSSIKAFVLGVLGLSYAPYNIYDYNDDGVINGIDALKITKIIGGIDENTKIITGKVEINSDNPKNCMVVYDNYNAPIVSIGLGGVNTNLLTATNIVCGHDENGTLKGTMINGETGRIYINNPNGIVDIDPGNKFWLLNGGLNTGIQMSIPRGEISCAGDVYCNSVIQTSLKEKKKNFERLDNALDIIKNIDIYKYNMKEDKDTDKKHIGFVIGDKFNYSKEVTSNNNDGVDTYAFVSVCCKAIQEQQEEINLLKQEIKLLKERIDK